MSLSKQEAANILEGVCPECRGEVTLISRVDGASMHYCATCRRNFVVLEARA